MKPRTKILLAASLTMLNFGLQTLNSFAQFTKLLDFTGANGSYPAGSLISDGAFLYGMTSGGGTNNLGTLFKIKPDGSSYVKLLDFSGATDGSNPYGSLISDSAFLYGMTSRSGTNNVGVIFKYGILTGIAETNSNAEITIYPNPAANTLTISYNLAGYNHASLRIMNSLGQTVMLLDPLATGKNQLDVEVSKFSAGNYFYQLKTDDKAIITKKLTIMH